MKILIHSCHFDDPIGIGKFSAETAEWLSRHGHDVRVLAAPPYYPQWHIAGRHWNLLYRKNRTAHGATVLQCPIWVPKRPSGLFRIINYTAFGLSSLFPMLWWCLTWRPDIVWNVMPPVAALPGALAGARLAGGCCWLHIQDLEVDAAFDLGLLNGATRLRSTVLAVERKLMAWCGAISTVSRAMARRIDEKRVGQQVLLMPNWADIDAIFPLEGRGPLRAQLAQKAQFVALYSGNLGRKQGVETLVQAARLLRDRQDIRLVICGDGAMREELVAAGAALPNLGFLPLQPLSQLNALLNAADVHLLPQRDEVKDLVMPSKLGGMLASGRPVIAAAVPDSEVALAICGAGILVPPGDARAMANAIVELQRDRDLYAKSAAMARESAVAQWAKAPIMQRFEALAAERVAAMRRLRGGF